METPANYAGLSLLVYLIGIFMPPNWISPILICIGIRHPVAIPISAFLALGAMYSISGGIQELSLLDFSLHLASALTSASIVYLLFRPWRERFRRKKPEKQD